MQFTLGQVVLLFAALSLCWWAVKGLFIHYTVRHLVKNRFCMKCLERGDGKVILDAAWTVKTEDDDVPVFLCDSCKREEFPDEVGEFAEKQGYLIKEPNDYGNTRSS